MIKAETVSQPNFPVIEKQITNTFSTNFIKLTKLGAKYLRTIIPKKTGAMRASIEYSTNLIWTTSSKYRYIDRGTRAHVIEPKDGTVLRFRINGAIVFSKRVFHPGTRAQQLTDRTMIKISDNMPVLVKEINRAIA